MGACACVQIGKAKIMTILTALVISTLSGQPNDSLLPESTVPVEPSVPVESTEKSVPPESTTPTPPKVEFDPAILAKTVVPYPAEPLGENDPITLADTPPPSSGRKEISTEFDGQMFYFASEDNRARFAENPSAYAPVLNGFSVVEYKDGGRRIQGSPLIFSVFGRRLYLFSSDEAKKTFDAEPSTYAEIDVGLQGYSPVSLMDDESLQRGDKQLEAVFDGRRFRLTSAIERETFLANPTRYAPVLGGLDPVSIEAKSPTFGLARFAAVYKDRLYLFADDANREKFLSNPAAYSDLDVADSGTDPVFLVDDRARKPGHYSLGVLYRGQRFLFASPENREKFLDDMTRYAREWSIRKSDR